MPYLMVGKRAREVAAVAQKYHFEYLETEAFGITRRPLSLFSQGDGHLAENLLVGRVRGQEVYGFDYPFLSGPRADVDQLPDGFPTVRYENGNQYGCVLVPTYADLPMVFLAQRGRRGLLSPGVETPVRIENKAFAKMFQVWAEDPVFLHDLLVPELVDLLIRTAGHFTFEIFGDSILCTDRTVKPEQFPGLMGLVVAAKELFPSSIWERFPLRADEVPDELLPPSGKPSTFGALPGVAPGAEPDATPDGEWF